MLDENDHLDYRLPPRLSNAQDHWGFYNGANSNTTPLPEIYGVEKSEDANRTTDPEHTKAGLLQKITYPTGGFNEFEYEAHDVAYPTGILITNDKSFFRPKSATAVACYTSNPPQCTVSTDTEDFTLPIGTKLEANITITTAQNASWTGTISISSINGTGNEYVVFNNTTYNHSFFLPAGDYQLKVKTESSGESATAIITWDEHDVLTGVTPITSLTKYPIGGVRIQRIKAKESSIATPIVKRYVYEDYTNTNDPTVSSGKLLSLPNYLTSYRIRYSTYLQNGMTAYNDCQYEGITSQSITPLGTTQGSHISYTHVTELYGENGENGKIENEYSYQVDAPSINSFSPIYYTTSYEWKRGHLIRSKVYKNDGGNFVIQSETYNQYDFRETKSLKNFEQVGVNIRYRIKPVNFSDDWSSSSINLYNFYTYRILAPWYYLAATTQTTFDENGQNPITSNTSYIYDEDGTDGHQASPIETRTTNSDGIEYITQTKYSSDYIFTGSSSMGAYAAAIDWMQQNNRIVPIEQISLIKKPSWSQPKVIGGSLSTFKVNSYNDGTNPPWESLVGHETHMIETVSPIDNYSKSYLSNVNHLQIPSEYALKGTIHTTNEKGKLAEYSRTGDISTSIIWNGESDLPIAKVINASSDEVFYTSFEEIYGGLPKGKTGQKSNIGSYTINTSSLNTSLSNNNFILSYWKSSDGDNWDFVKQQISVTGNITISPSGANYIDEVRLYPADAIMTTVSYDPNTRQVTHMTNENGQLARFEYDDFQRLKHVFDFENNLISKYIYNYQNTQGSGNDVYNHIQSWTFLKEGVTPTNFYQNQVIDGDVAKQYQFMDGLGRPVQTIAVEQAADGGDIVSHIQYDQYGRTSQQFMPFVKTGNNGSFVTNAFTLQQNYNQTKYGTLNSFMEAVFDNSPLNRVTEQGAVGNEWQIGTGHTIRNNWRGNTATEVYDFENQTHYPANSLFVTETRDENNTESWTYTDKIGRTILTKREAGTKTVSGGAGTIPSIIPAYASVYYIYDDFGRIEKVLSPEATERLEGTSVNYNVNHPDLSDLIYTYTYDHRGRMVEKKIPGAATQYIAYDELDRVVLTQDGNLRGNSQWLFTEYDILSRPITTGIYTPSAESNTRSFVQNSIQNAGVVMYESRNSSFNGYTESNAFPTSNFEILSVTYYDDYDFDGNGTPNHLMDGTYTTETPIDYIHGKLTGTRVKILDGGNNWLNTVTFYDDRSRVIQVKAENHIGGDDITTNIYDFAGRLLETVRDHTQTDFSAAAANLLILSRFTYDHTGRLLTGTYGIGSDYTTAAAAQIVLNAQEYDQIGQLVNKKLHSGNQGCSYLQSVDFEYNIRGWLTAINNSDDLTTTGVKQMCEVNTTWTNPHNNQHTYYYADERLEPNEDGIMELVYDGTIRTYCSWRRILPDGSDKPMMQLVKHTNGSWYVWDKNFSTRMSRPASFVNVGDVIRLSREGDDFNVYVNGVLEFTIYEPNSSQEKMIPVGILSNGGQTDKAFYKERYIASDDLFAMKFDYTTTNSSTGAVAQYNGNISQIEWRTIGNNYSSLYGFEYDELNRLVNAKYVEKSGATTYTNQDQYTVSNITYDLNGNIQTLDRAGFINTGNFGSIDQLSYTYKNNSNILETVSDAINSNTKGFKEINTSGVDYVYDANGNMTSDYNKGITITYNHMNLPKKVQYATGQVIDWVYDAAGVKLYKKTNDGSGNTTEKHYIGGLEYAGTVTNNIDVEAIYHSEGRLTPNGNGYRYEYTLKDHLGNARVSFADIDNNGEVNQSEILQTNHYYPFGMRHEGKDLPQQGITNAYQYNAKELNADFGLDWLDYDARWYDASIARWSAVDPLAEKYVAYSEYAYVFNNPLRFTDPDGRSPDDIIYLDSYGKEFHRVEQDGEDKVFIIKTTTTVYNLYGNEDGVIDENAGTVDGITAKESRATKKAIKEGREDEVMDKLVELPSTENRIADAEYLEQDNGQGGTSDANNREYQRTVYENGDVEESKGPVSSPKFPTAEVSYKEYKSNPIKHRAHSHPSGEDGDYYYNQAPSAADIGNIKEDGAVRVVFARGEDNVYLYTNKGVVARMKTSAYKRDYSKAKNK